jgi:hypothetical protein
MLDITINVKANLFVDVAGDLLGKYWTFQSNLNIFAACISGLLSLIPSLFDLFIDLIDFVKKE